MALDMFRGTQWSREEIEKMNVGRPSSPLVFNKIDPALTAIWSAALTKDASKISTFGILMDKDLPQLFADKSGGFQFDRTMWKNMWVADRARYIPDALAHRDEAMRRMVVCRLEDRKKEAAHWLAQMRFLENLYKLPEVSND